MNNSINNSPHSSNNVETGTLLGSSSITVSNNSKATSEPSSWFSKFPDLSACASTIGRFTSSCLKSLGSTISWPFYQCAAAVSRFIYGTKEDINSTNIKAIENEYGSDMASNYSKAFLELGGVEQKTTEEIKSDFEELPPQDKTMTLLSKGVISVSKMGYYTNPKGEGLNAAPDAVIPKGGFARIYGEAERKAMLGTLNNELTDHEITLHVDKIIAAMKNRGIEIPKPSDPYQLLAYGKAMSLDWDRVRLEVPDKNIARPKAGADPYENLNTFKGVIQSVTGNIVSDRAAYEMMRLIDQEGLSGGFASGSDPKTGLGFGQDRMTNMDENVVHISLGPDKSVLFNYSSAKAYLSSITTPSPDSKRIPPTTVRLNAVLSSDGNGVTLDPDITPVNRENTNVPQYELKMEYTYAYTFHASTEGKENVNLLDSRVAYWPIRLIPANIQSDFAKELNAPERDEPDLTANIVHIWDSDEENDNPLPKISQQFYLDIDSGRYFLSSSEGNSKPLYDKKIDNLDDDAHEKGRQEAIKEFFQFVGDNAKALAISKVANQQLSFAPLLYLMNTHEGPLQLDGYSGGLPLGKTMVNYTFLKSLEDNFIIRVQTQQKPQQFSVMNKGNKVGDNIELDAEKSLVTFDYDLTCHFDNDGKLSITSGPINYTCQLAESASQETLAKF